MKKVTMFYLENCPHCKNAQKMMDELKNVRIASNYDYYYVPTYYVDGQKIHEGVPTLDKVENVFKKAIEV